MSGNNIVVSTHGKVITCQAAVAWCAGKPLSIETIEVSPPQAHEVRIKIVSAGLCGTDNYVLSSEDVQGVAQDGADELSEILSPGLFPIILGHEGAGIVESIGEGVTNVAPGDHVMPIFLSQCYECKFCKNPKTNMCQKLRLTQGRGLMPDGTTRFRCKGSCIYHFMGCSTFSQYTVAADVSVCKINPAAPLDKICIMGCAIPTGYGTSVNTVKVEPGSTVAIFGLGGVGLAATMGAKNAGAKRIIGIDTNPKKFAVAKKFGVTECLNPKDHDKPVQQVLSEMTDGGVDHAVECVGNVKTMRSAFESCHKGWGVAAIVGLSPAMHEISIAPFYLLTGRRLKGSVFGDYKSRDSVPGLVEQYLEGKIMVDEFISHRFPLDRINEAFEMMRAGNSECIRCVINMDTI